MLWWAAEGSGAAAANRRTEEALARAKEALLVYASGWPRRDIVNSNDPAGTLRGPGLLPCPDRNDNGHADDGGCGSASGEGMAGQAARLGRLPYLTLGLPELRDGDGNRLWYAVSSQYKSLTAPAGLGLDSGPGTISIRSSSGALLHDGSLSAAHLVREGGVAAVIIAPGPPLARWLDARGSARSDQVRSCAGSRCDAIAANWLDIGWFSGGAEDNAGFRDRNTAPRAANVDGFIEGPIRSSSGEIMVNDRLLAITVEELQAVTMRRVADEVVRCLLQVARATGGRVPFPAPVCRSGQGEAPEDWREEAGFRFGRVPEPPFVASQAALASFPGRWPSGGDEACMLDGAGEASWWRTWRNNVFLAVSQRALPTGAGGPCVGVADATCLPVLDEGRVGPVERVSFAVIVSGPPLAGQDRSLPGRRFAAGYLEGPHVSLEGLNSGGLPAGCLSPSSRPGDACADPGDCPVVVRPGVHDAFNDFVVPVSLR